MNQQTPFPLEFSLLCLMIEKKLTMLADVFQMCVRGNTEIDGDIIVKENTAMQRAVRCLQLTSIDN